MTEHEHVLRGHALRYLRIGQGSTPLLFLQGFGIAPRYYQPLFDALSDTFEIIAPDLLRANRFRGQPTTLPDLGALVADFVHSLGLDGFVLAGHSLGGAVAFQLAASGAAAPRHVVGLNPALPTSFGPSGFIRRSIQKSARESVGREGLQALWFANRFHTSFIYHSLRDLKTTAKVASEVCALDYKALRVSPPTLILFGERDEFFSLTPFIRQQLERAFDALTIKRLRGLNHDWPVFQPQRAADELRALAAP